MNRFLSALGIFFAVAVVFAVVGGGELLAMLPSFGGGGSGVEVRLEDAAVRDVVQTASAPGYIEPMIKVDISAEVSERIVELPFREGQSVRKGDVLVRLDDRDLSARLAAATARLEAERGRLGAEKARLDGPRMQLQTAKSALERQEALFRSGDISRQALEEAQTRVQDIQAGLAASERTIGVIESSVAASAADIERAQRDRERTVLRSPMDGVVIRLNAEVGELVVVGTMNNAGTVIMTVADLSHMRMVAEVAEADIARVKLDQLAEVFVNAYKDRSFKGTVAEIAMDRSNAGRSATISASGSTGGSGTYKVEIDLALSEQDQLLSGLAANADIQLATANGIAVPTQAVVERKLDDLPASVRDGALVDRTRKVASVVFVVEGGVARAMPVRIGQSSLTDTIVLEGISAGDRVVAGPYKALDTLRDGMRVTEAAATPDGGASIEVRIGT
ncbi:MAG: efflux RND transporter periplasmic adaptor subunit [Planctomycetes bacterium]|nr:efflux RND transporter periplasmic adaptor subunit [Planctomycetota bacterium]